MIEMLLLNAELSSDCFDHCSVVGFVFCHADFKKQLKEADVEHAKELGKILDRLGRLVQVRKNVTSVSNTVF
jgi:hypothetical protein